VIHKGASARLLIVSFLDVTSSHSLLEMSIQKLLEGKSVVQWWARWLVEEKEELPLFKSAVGEAFCAYPLSSPWPPQFANSGGSDMKPA
jgi:hypothetical protein